MTVPATLEGILAQLREEARTLDRALPPADSPALAQTVPLELLRTIVTLALATRAGMHVRAFPLPEEEERNRVERAHWAAGRALYEAFAEELPTMPRWEGLREETQETYVRQAGRAVAAYEEERTRE